MRRLSLLVVAVVAAAATVLVPSPARAVVADGGSLSPGTSVNVEFAAPDDAVTYTLDVPPSARPTVAVAADTSTVQQVTTRLEYADGSDGGQAFYSGSDPSSALLEHRSGAGPATLTVTAGGTGSFAFTLVYPSDSTVAIESGDLVPLSFDTGGRARLTFDADAGAAVHVSVVADELTPGEPRSPGRVAFLLEPQGSGFVESAPAEYLAEVVAQSGRQTVVVDPVRDLTGGLTVRVNVSPPGAVGLAYGGGASSVTLEAPGQVAEFVFQARGGAPTVLQAVRPALVRGDGSPGSATLELLVPGEAPVLLGQVGQATVSFTTGAPLESGEQVTVRVVADGDSAGTLPLRLFLDPGPASPLTVGARTTLALPAGPSEGRWAWSAGADEPFELFFDAATFSGADATTARVRVESEAGDVLVDDLVFSFQARYLRLRTLDAGRYTLTLKNEGQASVEVPLTVRRTTVAARTVDLPFSDVLDVPEPAQDLEVAFVVEEGAATTVVVEDVSLDATTGASPLATISLLDPDGVDRAGLALTAGGRSFSEIVPGDRAGEYRLRIDPTGPVTGTVRVTVRAAPAVTGVLEPVGVPTRISVPEQGGLARYTFDATAGDQLAFDLDDVAITGGFDFQAMFVSLIRPDGTFFASAGARRGEPGWIEPLDGLDATGTWTLLVDPQDSLTGALTVTRVRPRVLTSPLPLASPATASFERPGDVHRLTFTGRAGQRPVLRIENRTVPTRMRLISPTGLVAADIASFDVSPLFELSPLSAGGTWTLELDAFERGTGSVDVRLDLVRDTVRTIQVGQQVATTFTAGQNARFRVVLERGRHLAVDIRNVSPSGMPATLRYLRPDGSVAFEQAFNDSDQWSEMFDVVDVGGRWTLELDPEGAAEGTVAFVVRSAPDRVYTGRLARTTSVTVAEATQNAVFPFRVRASARTASVSYRVTGSTFRFAQLRLVDPAGASYGHHLILPGDTSGEIEVPPGASGRWRLVLDPADGATGTARLFFDLVEQPAG